MVNNRAALLLDGEKYEEFQSYDRLMIEKMWGYPLMAKEKLAQIENADKNVEKLLKKKLLNSSGKIFISGTRHGSYFIAMQNKGLNVAGVDENLEMVEFLNGLVEKKAVVKADMTELPYSDESLDVGFFHSSLFMNENTQLNRAELKEIIRVLKKNGLAIIEGANGQYWEPIRKKSHDLNEYLSPEEGLWALKKDPSLAKWRRRDNFLWLEFFFITQSSQQLRVNHAYHFVPKQEELQTARYYHEVVNYEPFEYRLRLLNEEGFTTPERQSLKINNVFADYNLTNIFDTHRSPGGVIIAKKP